MVAQHLCGECPATNTGNVNSEKTNWRGRVSLYAPLFLWIGLIFFLSSGSGSMSATSKFVRPLLEFLFPTATEDSLQLMHYYIRKAAHFTEYGILALWAIRALRRSSVALIGNHFYIFAGLLVVIVACFDESYQSFNASRTSSIWDVLLDIGGGFFAIFMVSIISMALRKKRHSTVPP